MKKLTRLFFVGEDEDGKPKIKRCPCFIMSDTVFALTHVEEGMSGQPVTDILSVDGYTITVEEQLADVVRLLKS